jgi:sugar phosphate isomerase/epimerase
MKKIALCTIAFRERPLEEVLELARETGFNGVEIWGKEPHVGENADKQRVIEIRKMLDRKNLQVSVFGSYLKMGTGEDINRIETICWIAQQLKTPLVRVWAGNKSPLEASKKEWNNCIEELKEVSEKARKWGLTLIIEMHNNSFAETGNWAKKLIDKTGENNVKLNFQVHHPPDKENPYSRIKEVASLVENVHVQNRKQVNGKWEISLLEEGSVDYKPIYQELQRVNFTGYMEVEFVKGSSLQEKKNSLIKDYRYLKRL